MTKRTLSVCLAFVLLLGTLVGCSKNETKTDDSGQNTQQETIPELASQYAYQPQYFDLPEPIQWISRSCVSGSTLYFTASILSGQDTYIDKDGNEVSYDTYSEGLFRFEPDSGECVQLVNYVDKPDVEDLDDGTQIFRSSNSSAQIHALAAGTDGTLWIYRRTDLYTDDGEMGPSLSELIQLDAHGTLLRTIIPANEEDPNSTGDWGYSYLDTLLSDDKGYVYTYDYQTVNVYGPDGSFVFSKSADELSGQLCQLSAGEVGALITYNDGKMAFKQLDPETKNWGKETPVSSRAWSLQPGNDVYRYFFIDGGNIFGERKDTGEVEKVVDWLACDVDSNTIGYNRLGFLADGRIATVTLGHSYDGTRERQRILVLSRMDAADVQQKTELTLACFSLDYNLRSQIVKFNQTSTDCRIVVRDYAEYADGEDYYAGLTVFNTEVLAGKIPDLIVGNMMLPIRQYAARGMLENLWPYLDADPGYSRDKLMTRPVEAAQVDGKLYQLPINFGITTAVGLGRIVGDYTTWTLADVKNALSKLPEGAMVFNQYYTQSEMLMYCVAMNAKGFMDWQNGTCNFDSDEFRALLEFVKPLPAEFSWQSDEEYESDFTRMKSGKQLLYPMNLNDFDNIYYTFAALDHDIRFVGFPREDGSSGSAFTASVTLCITTACKDKAGAWAFVRSALSEEYQKNLWNFPILRSAFDAMAGKAMTQEYQTDANGSQVLDENGDPIPISSGGMSYGDEPMIELYAVTQEQYDTVMELIESTTNFLDYDQSVLSIITEEAAGYLAGDRSVEEASRLIQSRVNLYIQEQK